MIHQGGGTLGSAVRYDLMSWAELVKVLTSLSSLQLELDEEVKKARLRGSHTVWALHT